MTTCAAGYSTIGSELQKGAVALRAEARNYFACFESPLTEKKNTRNDVARRSGSRITCDNR